MSLTSLHQQNTDECVEFAYELNRLLDILAVDVYGFLSSRKEDIFSLKQISTALYKYNGENVNALFIINEALHRYTASMQKAVAIGLLEWIEKLQKDSRLISEVASFCKKATHVQQDHQGLFGFTNADTGILKNISEISDTIPTSFLLEKKLLLDDYLRHFSIHDIDSTLDRLLFLFYLEFTLLHSIKGYSIDHIQSLWEYSAFLVDEKLSKITFELAKGVNVCTLVRELSALPSFLQTKGVETFLFTRSLESMMLRLIRSGLSAEFSAALIKNSVKDLLADGNVCLSISSDVAWRELLALVPSLSGSYSIKSFPVVLKVSPLVRTAIKAIKCVLLGIFGEGIFDSDSRSFIYGFISRLYRKHSWCNLQTLTLNFYMRLSKILLDDTITLYLKGIYDVRSERLPPTSTPLTALELRDIFIEDVLIIAEGILDCIKMFLPKDEGDVYKKISYYCVQMTTPKAMQIISSMET
ncbi:hypothetical protein MDAP_002856 [Mitosporidium daphniae]